MSQSELMKKNKTDLVRLLEALIDVVNDDSSMYASSIQQEAGELLESHGVKLTTEVVYEARVKLHLKRAATIPDSDTVRDHLHDAIYNWMTDNNPCVFPEHSSVEDDFKVISVKVVEA